jgi:hypothetical protein
MAVAIGVALCLTTGPALLAQRGAPGTNPQAVLRADVAGMTARLAGGPGTPRQAMLDAQRLAVGYRSLVPLVGGFGPAEYAANREMARASLAWLGRASLLYPGDAATARAFLDAYDTIGGFYRGGPGRFYYPGAYVAYAGATRLARRLYYYDWAARELDRYALAYGALAVHDGTLVGRWTQPGDLPAGEPPATVAGTPLKVVEMPRIDAATLTPEQREAWSDVRDRFRSVSTQVHAARVLLDQLSARLHGQGVTLHPENAAMALKMQGFLEDAAELMQARDFEAATDYLRRADAERTRLKSVTGQ